MTLPLRFHIPLFMAPLLLLRHCLALFLALLLCFGLAEARTIEIISGDRLEFRNVTPPGGGPVQEYIIISGRTVVLKIDNDELVCQRVEFNKTERKLVIIGEGTYRSKKETLQGKDFVIDLDTEALQTEDVFIATKEIDVIGVAAERLPGQIEVQNGVFSPCARCGQNPNDYGFRAETILIYPGDRLIASNATLLLADEPVMFIPLVVFFLNDPNRQPRLEVTLGTSEAPVAGSPDDGTTIEADLPFVTGTLGFGMTYLRTFQKRDPGITGGFDYQAYLFEGAKPTRLSFFAMPMAGNALAGANAELRRLRLAYRLETEGNYDLSPDISSEDGGFTISFRAQALRLDTGLALTEFRGVSFQGRDQETGLTAAVSLDNTRFGLRLALDTFIDQRDPKTIVAGSQNNRLRTLPELTAELKTGQGLSTKLGPIDLKLSTLRFSLANLTGAFNPLNNSAKDLAKDSTDGQISALRLSEDHRINANLDLWEGGEISADNSFSGRYYSTRNPVKILPGSSAPLAVSAAAGEFERLISLNQTVTFNQRLDFLSLETTEDVSPRESGFNNSLNNNFGNQGRSNSGSSGNNSFSLKYSYSDSGGETPFAPGIEGSFISGVRKLSEKLDGALNLQPWSWVSFSAQESLDLRRKTDRLTPLALGLSITPNPLSASASLQYDLEDQEPIALNSSARLSWNDGALKGFSFGITNFTYSWATKKQLALNPQTKVASALAASASYSNATNTFSSSLGLTRNNISQEITLINGNITLNSGDRENPLSLNLQENYTPPIKNPNYIPGQPGQPVQDSTLNGNITANGFGLSFGFNHLLNFTPWTAGQQFGNVPPSNFSLTLGNTARGFGGFGNQSSGFTWGIGFKSNIDLATRDFYNPSISLDGSFSSEDLTAKLGVDYNFPVPNTLISKNVYLASSVSTELALTIPSVFSVSSTLKFNMPVLFDDATINDYFELAEASNTRIAWQFAPGAALVGQFGYKRTRAIGAKDKPDTFAESYSFPDSGFGLRFALQRPEQPRPEVIIEALLVGTYTWNDPGTGGTWFYNPSPTAGSAVGSASSLRPIINIWIDRCCYGMKLTFDATPQKGAAFRFSFYIPLGNSESIWDQKNRQDFISADPVNGIRFPAFPFIPSIKPKSVVPVVPQGIPATETPAEIPAEIPIGTPELEEKP
jgi:hypothetical protein